MLDVPADVTVSHSRLPQVTAANISCVPLLFWGCFGKFDAVCMREGTRPCILLRLCATMVQVAYR